jgi:DNA-binding transcriptional MocR family regulator
MSQTSQTAIADPHRYQQIADRLMSLIRKGSLKPGNRIPSIRKMSEQSDVSPSTVMQAYRLLEDQGWIEARPQSGYFVRPRHLRRVSGAASPPEPEIQRMPLTVANVRKDDALWRNMNISRQKGLLPLGAALPSAEFLPTTQLNRMLLRAVRENPLLASRYEVSPGLEELRVQIARRLVDAGCTIGPDDLIVTSGATEALSLALQALTEPGDTVVVESPCYFGLLYLLRCLRLKVVEVCAHPRTGISLDEVERLLRSKAIFKAIVLTPNVHNPLGGIMPNENKRRLVELLSRQRIPIIEDDTYSELAFESPRPTCIKAFDTGGSVITCGSFSKVLAPGYRIGWIAPDRWHEAVQERKLATSLACATPSQVAVARFLKEGGFDHHLRRLRRVYREQLRLMGDAITRSFPAGTRATRPSGGHILWVQLPDSVNAYELERRAAEKGINVAPGPIFSARGSYRNFVRLNAAVGWSAKIETALAEVGRLAQELAG